MVRPRPSRSRRGAELRESRPCRRNRDAPPRHARSRADLEWATGVRDERVRSAKIAVPGPPVRKLVAFFATTFGSRAAHWVAQAWRGENEPRSMPDLHYELPAAPAELDIDARIGVPTSARYG